MRLVSSVKGQRSKVKGRVGGFTLVEMIVAFGIFAVIMVISVGSLLSLLEANRKAQAQKSVVNNLHFAFENIARQLRMGARYHCNAFQGDLGAPADCATTPASSIAFSSRDGERVIYRLRADAIERSRDGGILFLPLTAPEIRVDRLQFFVDGSSPTDRRQPRVLLTAAGVMQGKSKVASRFEIETLLSQRQLDAAP
mgnify:CR=1 FL=1